MALETLEVRYVARAELENSEVEAASEGDDGFIDSEGKAG